MLLRSVGCLDTTHIPFDPVEEVMEKVSVEIGFAKCNFDSKFEWEIVAFFCMQEDAHRPVRSRAVSQLAELRQGRSGWGYHCSATLTRYRHPILKR